MMRTCLKLWCILLLWISYGLFTSGQNQNTDEDIDSIIDKVFPGGGGGEIDLNPQGPNIPESKGPDLQPNPSTGQEDNPDCTCVAYYLCDNGTVNTDGKYIIDIRIRDGPCENAYDICCGKENRIIQPPPPVPKPNRNQPLRGCGFRNPEGIGFRIIGDQDNESQFAEFPWMVALLREEYVEGNPDSISVYQCGGALIHPQVVLTAAHCVSNTGKNYMARMGEWDTQTKNELYPHQDRHVIDKVIHHEYYAGALFNDVALLFLDSPVDYAENVNSVCLPPQNETVNYGRCFVSGWGTNVFGKKGKYQVILKRINIPMVDRRDCQMALRNTRLGEHFELHNSFVCAGGEPGNDACKGDGGSPLVCPIKGQVDRFYQVGIVAWGIGCGEGGTPGVYANVAIFRDWITEQLRIRHLNSSSYNYY